MRVEKRPERRVAVGTGVVRNLVVDEPCLPFLGDEPRVLQQPQVARDAGLGNSQNARQLADIEAILRQGNSASSAIAAPVSCIS